MQHCAGALPLCLPAFRDALNGKRPPRPSTPAEGPAPGGEPLPPALNDIQASIGSAPAFFLLQFNPGTEAGLHLTDLCLTPNYHMNGRERLQKALTPTDPPSPLPASPLLPILPPRRREFKTETGEIKQSPKRGNPLSPPPPWLPFRQPLFAGQFALLCGRMRAAVGAFP